MSKSTIKREKFNVLFTPEEKQIVIEKAIKYGYGSKLAEYIRDACIYERLYVENIQGKQEIFNCIDEYLKEVRIYITKTEELLKKVNIQKEDILFIQKQNEKVMESINSLIKTVIKVLSTNSTSEFQKRLRLVEKNKVSFDLIDSIIKKQFLVIQPSTLNYKRLSNLVLLVYHEHYKIIDIENLNYNALIILIDEQREYALQNNFYLLFRVLDNKLKIEMTKCFSKYDEAMNFYNEAKEDNIIEIMDFFEKEG